MGIDAIFSAEAWRRVPFHLWSGVFFVLGSMVGSFLNVCIHRLPIGESIVSPPSHCPHCKYSIPWYLNVPLVTWLWLRGKCANCGAPIAARYFLVELLTALLFLGCWLTYGHQSAGVALACCVLLAGMVAASFIDLEHFIIPDGISLGGVVVGFVISGFVPALHHATGWTQSLKASFIGIVVGGGIVYVVLRLGKLFFGRWKIKLEPGTRVVFTEYGIVLEGEEMPYGEFLYRKTDVIKLKAEMVELCDRCYRDVPIRLSMSKLIIGDEAMNPEEVPYMEVTTDLLVLPREAMGLGDVKFMAAIGAFLGWQATVFSLAFSSFIGAIAGIMLIALRRLDKSRPVPYGPYIAVAAAIWIFGGHKWWEAFFAGWR